MRTITGPGTRPGRRGGEFSGPVEVVRWRWPGGGGCPLAAVMAAFVRKPLFVRKAQAITAADPNAG